MGFIIEEARALVVSAPLVTPFRIATGQHNELENVFLQIRTSKGICGYGEAAVASHITGETIPQTLANLQHSADQLTGLEVGDTNDLINRFRPCFKGNHSALAAFEMALLDAAARSRGIPFGALFSPAPGCKPMPRFSSDITIVIGSLAEAEQAAHHYAAQGFNAFKIKVGRDHELDLQRVLAVKRISPASSLILDANMGFNSVSMLKFLDRLQAEGVRPDLLEQPVPKGDWDGLAAVTREASRNGTLVCADESVGSLADAERAIELKAVSAINIKFMKTGIMESVQIAELTCRHGIRLMLGAMMESGLAITASAHFAASLGCFDFIDLDTTFFIKGPMAHCPYLDAGGRFDLSSQQPGIGIEPPTSMIHHPLLIVTVLLSIELLVLLLSRHARTQHLFSFLPPVFWIYFLPMLTAAFGIIDPNSPVYGLITTWLLPASLILLLLPVDIKSILRLGPMALLMFFIGALGIITGTALAFSLFKPLIGSQFWAGFGALSASWTGGSANMIAVKEALAVPDQVFAPMVIVDTVVPYLWMGTLIAGVSLQSAFDRWNRSDCSIIDNLSQRISLSDHDNPQERSTAGITMILLVAASGSGLAHLLARQLPVIRDVVSGYTWTILIVSLLGILLSCTPARKLEQNGASATGYHLLYFVLTAIGAKASVANIGSAMLLIAAGLFIVAVHALFLLVAARFFKVPLFLVVAASQANIGGVASAPVVAEVYQPGLASVGLLLAILGNIFGTYMGICCAQICRMI